MHHHAEAEDVGLVVDTQPASLFGRHELWCADEHSGVGPRPEDSRGIVAGVARSGQLGNAEVEELGQAVRANHHVVRFDIAMHDPRGMRLVQRRGNLSCDIENEPVIERLRSLELGQRLPVDELGGDEMRAFRFADLVNRDDVRMIQRRRRPGFPDESVHPVAVGGEFRRQDLECDFTVKRRILRQIHLAHPALAEWRQDSVLLDGGVRRKLLHWIRPDDAAIRIS